jgi:phosphoesterase RecJ-like protein
MVPERLRDRLAAAQRVLLSSHANPDGDAIGSELGLARALRALGKQVAIWNVHSTPALYAQLPGSAAIHSGEAPPAGFPGGFDLAVALECPSLERTGLAGELTKLPLLNVDHHLGNTLYGTENWVDPAAPAVGVMVADLVQAMGGKLDRETADCLLVALITDTGGFRFPNATPVAFRAAARLVELGAEVERVSLWLYESQPEPAIRLLGELLSTLERHHGHIATVLLTLEMFYRAGAGPGDSEGLIDTPRSIAGVDAVALFRELGHDDWKISLRSRGAVDVERIARTHGGGGHHNAAGCRFKGPLATVQSTFVAALRQAIEDAHDR